MEMPERTEMLFTAMQIKQDEEITDSEALDRRSYRDVVDHCGRQVHTNTTWENSGDASVQMEKFGSRCCIISENIWQP